MKHLIIRHFGPLQEADISARPCEPDNWSAGFRQELCHDVGLLLYMGGEAHYPKAVC